MIEWSEQHRQIRAMVRRFVETEIEPNLDDIEFGDTPPYAILRKMVKLFGLREMAKAGFKARIARERARADGDEVASEKRKAKDPDEAMSEAAMKLIPIIELCRYSPGMVTALGVSMGLTANAIMAKGTIAQKERWALDLLTLDKIGAWAITEPNAGSDAFGGMKATARRDGNGGYILNGAKTFITNGPYADTTVFICKLDEGNPAAERKVLSFVLDKGMAGFEQSKPLRKMGLHSSPTGEIFVDDLAVGKERLLGESEASRGKSGARDTFTTERTAVAAMALGIIERCLELSTDYARTRIQFGKPIGEFQLIQLKLARMEVARMNIQNLVFRQIELAGAGKSMSLAEASACKLYSAQAAMEVSLEAVQLFGGNGYMSEYRVEQLCRDAKVLQIYGGTDEIQVTHIARDLLSE
jgi:alkylation response protein AidB-like acyl-CoA dehydrogenase